VPRVKLSRYFHRGFQVHFRKRSFLAYFAAFATLFLGQLSFAERSLPRGLDLSPAKQYIEINFAPGQSNLDIFTRENLDELVRAANLRGKIDQVTVLSWGDSSASNPEANFELAASRARAVETYLNSKGIGLGVQTYNLAKSPKAIEDLVNNADANLKVSIDQAGVAHSLKSSRVVVLLTIREN
jgi:hypothetical protein